MNKTKNFSFVKQQGQGPCQARLKKKEFKLKLKQSSN